MPVQKTTPPVAWAMARGESVVFSAGVAACAVVLGILAASSWWTLYTYRHSLERGREEQVQAVASLIGDQAIGSMVAGKPSEVRQLMVQAAGGSKLSECRVVLMDGTVIADAEPSKINKAYATAQTLLGALPAATGTGAPATNQIERSPDGQTLHLRVPLEIAGHGQAVLEIGANVNYPIWADWQVQAGIGAIGVAGMVGLFATYRLMRNRLRGLGAIGDALRCVSRGETSTGALALSDEFGDEARAWNKLLGLWDTLREQAVLEKATDKLLSRGTRDGDLAAACDAMWTGFIILDDAAKIKYANGAASVLLRRKRDEVVGSDLAGYLDNPAAAEAMAAVASGKSRQRTSIEIERRAETGDRTILRFTARPVRREDSASAIVLIEDVTQQRVADESRNAFVAQATHELRTPLTNIRLYVETMVEDGENDAAVRSKCINVIGQEARRLERIVSDMLSVSEIEAGSLKLHEGEVRLDALFEELETDFRAQATDKEISLTFELPPKYPVIQADRDKLMLALNNLLANALKYTPLGGAVTVNVEAGTALVVNVADNGIGIAVEEQELIFEKFYRAKDRRIANITGSGIGLALARQVVRMHGGDITVKSQIDKGSTFTMTVPLVAAASGLAKAA